jgi:hypothetical protein
MVAKTQNKKLQKWKLKTLRFVYYKNIKYKNLWPNWIVHNNNIAMNFTYQKEKRSGINQI